MTMLPVVSVSIVCAIAVATENKDALKHFHHVLIGVLVVVQNDDMVELFPFVSVLLSTL
jgi:hypothetical protein